MVGYFFKSLISSYYKGISRRMQVNSCIFLIYYPYGMPVAGMPIEVKHIYNNHTTAYIKTSLEEVVL